MKLIHWASENGSSKEFRKRNSFISTRTENMTGVRIFSGVFAHLYKLYANPPVVVSVLQIINQTPRFLEDNKPHRTSISTLQSQCVFQLLPLSFFSLVLPS